MSVLKNFLWSVTMSDMQPDQPNQPSMQPVGPQNGQFFQPSASQGAAPQQANPNMAMGGGMPSHAAYQSMVRSATPKTSKLPLALAIVFGVLLLASSGFGLWAFGGYQDYKNNSDKKAAAAAEAATKAEGERKDAEFIEQEKQPYRTYASPDATGAIKITYPKSWSAFINEDDKTNPLIGYWHPSVVPGLQSGTAYALRMQMSSKSYSDEMKTYDSLVKKGTVKVAPYVPKNVSGVTGSRVTGEINKGQNDTMIVLPLRDKTLRIWTESPDFVKDFDGIVLENLKFTP
ncbi:hypothetical protein KC957_01870 [Candidatus Saccharibacteria bacterium]|nr:hypothetical protein [Candidatus Saccharibacteria bacterium]